MKMASDSGIWNVLCFYCWSYAIVSARNFFPDALNFKQARGMQHSINKSLIFLCCTVLAKPCITYENKQTEK